MRITGKGLKIYQFFVPLPKLRVRISSKSSYNMRIGNLYVHIYAAYMQFMRLYKRINHRYIRKRYAYWANICIYICVFVHIYAHKNKRNSQRRYMAAMTKATGGDAITHRETARISRGTVAGWRSDYRVRPEACKIRNIWTAKSWTWTSWCDSLTTTYLDPESNAWPMRTALI